jgi:hypothetical protein
MNGCGITLADEECRKTLLADMPELENLLSIEVRLRDNNLTTEGIQALKDLFGKGSKIKDMNLSL